MDIKKTVINGKILDVISQEEYEKNPKMYGYDCAIEKDEYVYPIKRINDVGPGMYTGENKTIQVYENPNEDEKDIYLSSNVSNFSTGTISGYMYASEELKNKEKESLSRPNIDNIFAPPIKEGDSQLMIGMKEAIGLKGTSFNNYRGRLGDNANNYLKLFQKPDLTIKKSIELGNALDLKLTLLIEDKNSDVANPINTVIKKVLNE